MNANEISLKKFNELNARMSALVTAKIKSVFGTLEERDVLRQITRHGIESANAMIVLIDEGITYDKWADFLKNINRTDGPLDIFENEAGDMAALLKEFCTAELSGAFELLKEQGVFKRDTVVADRDLLEKRLHWAEEMWRTNDEQDKQIEVLQAIDTSDKPQ